MKKIYTGLLVFALMFSMFSFPSNVKAAVTDWDVTGNYVISFEYMGGYYNHDMNLIQDNLAMLSGSGGHPAGGVHGYTWILNSGTVINNTIDFYANYTASIDAVVPQTTMHVTGTIDANGSMSGTWTDNYQGGVRGGTWTTISGLADADSDNDGVLNGTDYCDSGTTADSTWDVSWGTNRWEVRDSGSGVLKWYQNQPVKKGKGAMAVEMYDIGYTYGCNGHQILQMLKDEFGDVMNGHWKYGLSSSVIKDFQMDLNDGVLDGKYFIEKVLVPANSAGNTMSANALTNGVNFILKASGTAFAGDNIEFDAKCSFRTGSSLVWTDAVSTYEGYGTQLLDLYVNGMNVNWGPCDAGHNYEYNMVGDGNNASFNIYDVYYPNNTGNLVVDIYAQI